MSDVMCQLIARQLKSETDYATAMTNAFCEKPSEIVGLLLSLDTPDRITYARFNMPMSVAFAAHGAYLASSPLAFPADAGEYSILPANSGGYVLRDRFTAIPMKTPPMPVAPLSAEIRIKAYQAVKAALSKQEMIYADLAREVIQPLFESDGPCPVAALTYETLLALKTQGLLKERIDTIEGAFPNLTAPKVKLWI
jgi:hypothetical protein